MAEKYKPPSLADRVAKGTFTTNSAESMSKNYEETTENKKLSFFEETKDEWEKLNRLRQRYLAETTNKSLFTAYETQVARLARLFLEADMDAEVRTFLDTEKEILAKALEKKGGKSLITTQENTHIPEFNSTKFERLLSEEIEINYYDTGHGDATNYKLEDGSRFVLFNDNGQIWEAEIPGLGSIGYFKTGDIASIRNTRGEFIYSHNEKNAKPKTPRLKWVDDFDDLVKQMAKALWETRRSEEYRIMKKEEKEIEATLLLAIKQRVEILVQMAKLKDLMNKALVKQTQKINNIEIEVTEKKILSLETRYIKEKLLAILRSKKAKAFVGEVKDDDLKVEGIGNNIKLYLITKDKVKGKVEVIFENNQNTISIKGEPIIEAKLLNKKLIKIFLNKYINKIGDTLKEYIESENLNQFVKKLWIANGKLNIIFE